MPLVVFDRGKLEALGDLGHRHAAFHILLVGKDQQPCLSQILEGGEESPDKERLTNYKYQKTFICQKSLPTTFFVLIFLNYMSDCD